MERTETRRSLARFLRDNIWQFVGVIVSVIAILATYHIFFRQRPVKALQVVILANTSLVEVKQDMAEKITVSYEGKTISNLSVVQLKIENTGNQPIRREDYERPIHIVFALEAEIVEAEIVESNPPNIEMNLEMPQDDDDLSASLHPDHQGQKDDEEQTPNAAILSPTLLNPGDRVILRFLVINLETGGDTPPFLVDARVVGVKDVQLVSALEEPGPEFVESDDTWFWPSALLGLGLGLIGAVSAFITALVSAKNT
ncbi:hypothetical protein GF348_24375 [candidate division KSB3 bacterium]|nr:hypothetical protein [candidate division KSB3 bacterium]